MRLDLLVSPVIVPIFRYNDISLTYFEVFEGLAMSPEEGKCIEVDVPFHSQMFNFPEEGLKKKYLLSDSLFLRIVIANLGKHEKKLVKYRKKS